MSTPPDRLDRRQPPPGFPAPGFPAMGRKAWTLLIALALCWGGSFFFAEVALASLPALAVAWARVAGGALFLLLMLRASGLTLSRQPSAWRRYATMGLLNNALPFALIFQGQAALGAAAAAILNAATPFFAVVLADRLTSDERLTWQRGLGSLIGAAGVALLIGLESLRGIDGALLPALLVLGGALSYALAGIYGRRFRGEPPLATATGQVVCSTLWLLPLLLIVEPPWRLAMPDGRTWLALAALGLLSTAIAYRLYFRLLAMAGASNLLLVTLLIPPSAMALSFLFLGETPDSSELLGFAVIAVGLAVIDGRPWRAASRRRLRRRAARPAAGPPKKAARRR